MFGKFIKKIRSEKRLGLREFCVAADCDPSNWSKIEREILPPPQEHGFLRRIASILGLREDSTEWQSIFDLAAIGAGKIPDYVMEDDELVKKLPIFFRTVSGKKPTEDDLRRLAEILKNS